MKKDSFPEPLSEREIVTTRVIDAPRERVFKAWTDPEHLAQWWGPKGFTNTFQEFDMRPGGAWRFVMPGPDGVDYKNVFVNPFGPHHCARCSGSVHALNTSSRGASMTRVVTISLSASGSGELSFFMLGCAARFAWLRPGG